MRYALRNQDKIAKAHSQDKLNRIIKSLERHFNQNTEIQLIPKHISNEAYDLLFINDIGHSIDLIAFYVLEIKFDVYRLAFKEFIG